MSCVAVWVTLMVMLLKVLSMKVARLQSMTIVMLSVFVVLLGPLIGLVTLAVSL
jgi:hypothetical protein